MLDQGTVLQDRYKVMASLGKGGMGAIYKALDLRLDVYVAVKELVPQPGIDSSMLEKLRLQFRQEAATLARLDHANLVRVTDFFEERGNSYLVMDFLEGDTLAERIEREGALPEAQVVDLASQLLGALSYCHSQGVLHRDIKPQNILLRPDGRAILIDFGLVKLWDASNPQTQTVMRGMGTPEYAPPEQYATTEQHTGPRSDLYALGATLYHALTGERPLSATDRMALPERFVTPRTIAPGITAQTESVILKAMSLTLRDRWSSAEEMTTALKHGSGVLPPQPVYPAHPPTEVLTGQSDHLPAGTVAQPPKERGGKGWLWGIGGVVVGIGVVLVLCVGLLMLGAANDDGTPTPVPPVTQVVAVVTDTLEVTDPTLTPVSSNGDGDPFTLTINNNSDARICYVLLSPTENDQWGDDWLGENNVIDPGASWTFDVPGTPHDLMVMDCDEIVVETAWEISSDANVAIGGSDFIALEVHNESSVDICYAYFSPVTSDEWGQDWLGLKETIVADEGIRIFYIEPGTYDLLFRDCDNNNLTTEESVDLISDTIWTVED